jgi:hypothetical protein
MTTNKRSKANNLPCHPLDVKPVNLQKLTMEELCIAEAFYEEFKKARQRGESEVTFTQARLDELLEDKRRQKTETGKFSTWLPPGCFLMGTVDGERGLLVSDVEVLEELPDVLSVT